MAWTETWLAGPDHFPWFSASIHWILKPRQVFPLASVWEPLEQLRIFTVDGFLIDVDDRIVLGSPLAPAQLDAVPDAQAFLVDNLISQANFFSNAIDTETVGVDIVAAHNTDLWSGALAEHAGLSL
ncbi:MAG: hypothetical protein U5K38_04215 [Woeseiaceae bacterium]|nr:hypothetical protein [Woeseiaceae bacterium]